MMMELREKDIDQIEKLVNGPIPNPENHVIEFVNEFCLMVQNYTIIFGREETFRLLRANIASLQQKTIGSKADAMHEAYLMFREVNEIPTVTPDAE